MFGRWAEELKGQKAEGWEQRGEGHYQSYPRRVGPPARMEGYQHAGGRSHSLRVAGYVGDGERMGRSGESSRRQSSGRGGH